MIQIQTKGWKSSEFVMLVINMLIMIVGTIAKNRFGWEIPEEFWNLLLASFGGNAVYAAGRSHYKANKAKALASVINGNGPLLSGALDIKKKGKGA